MLGQVYLELVSARVVQAVGWNPASNSEAWETQFRRGGGTGGEDVSELAGLGAMYVGTLDRGRIYNALESHLIKEAATLSSTLGYVRIQKAQRLGLNNTPLLPLCTVNEELKVLVSIVRVIGFAARVIKYMMNLLNAMNR